MDGHRLARLIGCDLSCAVLVAVLYSPGLVGLTPSASSPILAAIAIVAGPALVAGAVAENVRLLRAPDTSLIDTSEAGDIDAEEVVERLRAYGHDRRVGRLASRIADQVGRAGAAQRAYEGRLRERFGSGATSRRFAATVAGATGTVTHNAAAAANLLASCDVDAMDEVLGRRDDSTQTSRRRLELYQGVLTRLGRIADGNDELLLAVESAQIDLSSLDETDEQTEEAMGELEMLAHDLDYYR